MAEKKIEIQKITIREKIMVENEDARKNLKSLLARILNVKEVNIEMRWEDRSKVHPAHLIKKHND